MAAVVLTGASRGLGGALLEALAARGDRVLGLARSFSPSQRQLAAARPDLITLRECDLGQLSDTPSPAELGSFVVDATEVALINNAATAEPLGAVGTLDEASLGTAIAVNLAAPLLLTNAFLAALGEATPTGLAIRSGVTSARILFITSSVARRAKAGSAVYCATKAGGEMYFDTLRAELESDARVAVEIVDPGGMDTDMHAAIRTAEGVYFPDQERLRQIAASGRLISPDVVARRILAEHLPDRGRLVAQTPPPS